jgi:hypothetical protein
VPQSTRSLLFVEAAAFAVAAFIHGGFLIEGYQHREARIAESVIAAVLVLGLVVTLVSPGLSRAAGLAAQGFALVGTLIGIFTMILGVGPRTAADIVYHIGIVTVLVLGLFVAVRAPASGVMG